MTRINLPPLPEPERGWFSYTADQMQAYATAAVEAEREACAKLCEARKAQACAAAIRARGEPPAVSRQRANNIGEDHGPETPEVR